MSNGGKQSLYLACQALFEKGDEVLIFSPYWVSYPEMVRLSDAEPINVKTDSKNQYEPDFESLENKITPNEFIAQFITLHKIKNLLIDRLICIVAEKTPVVRSELTSEERRINALGEHVRQESLGENE